MNKNVLGRSLALPLVLAVITVVSTNTANGFIPRPFCPTFHNGFVQENHPMLRPSCKQKPLLIQMSSEEQQHYQDGALATSMPARKNKHRVRNKKNKKMNKRAQRKQAHSKKKHEAVGPQDVAHHVACQYVTGKGGVLHENQIPTNRLKQQIVYAEIDTTQNSHINNIKRLERHPALVLNADYQPMSHLPLSMWNWQDAVKGVFSGKVTVVDVYPDVTIRAANLEIPLPSVIALNEYVPQFKQIPAFTKRNVFLRDEYRCQYCNDHFHTHDLSLDHVVPRCRGGKLNWQNAVTSCRKCNGRKGCLPVQELRSVGMKLLREPFVPTQFQLARVAGRMLPKRVHPTWQPFLGFTAGSEKDPNSNARNDSDRQGSRANSNKEQELFLDGL